MGQNEDQRARRARGQQLFDELAAPYLAQDRFDSSRMFGSESLKYAGSIVGFVGVDGVLVVKLEPTSLRTVQEAGATVPVRIGRGVAKAWIGLPFEPDPDTASRWTEALAAGVSAARASAS